MDTAHFQPIDSLPSVILDCSNEVLAGYNCRTEAVRAVAGLCIWTRLYGSAVSRIRSAPEDVRGRVFASRVWRAGKLGNEQGRNAGLMGI